MFFFFFNDTATTEIYTLSLHDALPICSSAATIPRRTTSSPTRPSARCSCASATTSTATASPTSPFPRARRGRSEEHTSELQSRLHLVCRLLLEKKKTHQWLL